MAFLERVTGGRAAPAKLEEVAAHYRHFGGVSPINGQVRELIDALEAAMADRGVDLPIFWGNRNWHPFLADTLAEMAAAGLGRAVALATSAFSSFSGCRQYWQDMERARLAAGPSAPLLDKIPPFWDQASFLEAQADRVSEALAGLGAEAARACEVVFTAHSIPEGMARASSYEAQLRQAAAWIAERVGVAGRWSLAFQSRSGPPDAPWLGPDISEHLRERKASGRAPDAVVVVPLGFLSDHMEVIFDLDVEAAGTAAELGIQMVRAATVGTHAGFVAGLADMIAACAQRRPLPAGVFGPQDLCGASCCMESPPAA